MFLSVVIPFCNEEETIEELYARLTETWNRLSTETGATWELICVNDGSRDRTMEMLQSLHQQDERVKIIDLSRNYGQQIAISAGLDYAQGEAVIVMDADLQDPPELMGDMIREWQQGFHMVYAVRRARRGETFFKKATSRLFYRLMRSLMQVDIPLDTGEFRLMDRRMVQEMRLIRERHRFLRGLSTWIGFRQKGIYFERPRRYAGETKYPLRMMLRYALDAVTSFSYQPLYMASYLGFFLSVAALFGAVLAIGLRLSGNNNLLEGQATTLVSVLLLGGVQLISVGIIGAYLGRIYDEVKGRPLYIVSNVYGLPCRTTAEINDGVPRPDAATPEESTSA